MSSEFAVRDSQRAVKARRSLRSQIIRGSAVGLLLVPPLFAATLAGGLLFGYHLVGAQGISMEPTLHHGDALWVKYIEPAEVEVGDIVTLRWGEEWITHRVVHIEPLPSGDYFVVTRGDANFATEEWQIRAHEKIGVAVVSFRILSHVLHFLETTPVRVLLGLMMVVIVAFIMRRRRTAKTSLKNC